MLEKARENLCGNKSEYRGADSTTTAFSFLHGSAEDLVGQVESGSVDLLIAAQACHWFDWTKVWPETQRVLRKDGTAAYWVYGEVRLPAFPSLTPLITEYAQGTDRNSTTTVGAYFQRPGRTILERLLVDVPTPESILGQSNRLKDFRRIYFTGSESSIPNDHLVDGEREVHPMLMRASWTWLDLLGYLRTWSALHSYHEKFPEDLNRDEDLRFLDSDLELARAEGRDESFIRGGDISIRFWKELRERARKETQERGIRTTSDEGVKLLDRVTVEWPVSLLCARKS